MLNGPSNFAKVGKFRQIWSHWLRVQKLLEHDNNNDEDDDTYYWKFFWFAYENQFCKN